VTPSGIFLQFAADAAPNSARDLWDPGGNGREYGSSKYASREFRAASAVPPRSLSIGYLHPRLTAVPNAMAGETWPPAPHNPFCSRSEQRLLSPATWGFHADGFPAAYPSEKIHEAAIFLRTSKFAKHSD